MRECILLVTQRITKYPALLERIIQNTEGSVAPLAAWPAFPLSLLPHFSSGLPKWITRRPSALRPWLSGFTLRAGVSDPRQLGCPVLLAHCYPQLLAPPAPRKARGHYLGGR